MAEDHGASGTGPQNVTIRPATTAEVDAALRQRELFGAADLPRRDGRRGRDARSGGGPPNQRTPLPPGLDGREEK